MKYVLLIMMFPFAVLHAQTTSRDSLYILAQRNLKQKNMVKALEFFTASARAGNAESMNALGRLYTTGNGVAVNETEGLNWFLKAAKNGYSKAWYNIGTMYKNGIGTSQNFALAYESFCKGATMNSSACYYGKGFMEYKGLGCTQNYQEAFGDFKIGSEKSSKAAMYMLGLCYRNGYGTQVNADSAGYWLKKAARLNYKYAREELLTSDPEIASSKSAVDTQDAAEITSLKKEGAVNKMRSDNTAGDYSGYAIRYDWSGKNVLSINKIELSMQFKNGSLMGIWKENDKLTSNITAQLQGDHLIFDNTGYSNTDHYNQKDPVYFEFKKADLQMTEISDSIFLSGNLQLWSQNMREPEKPIYISLTRKSDKFTPLSNDSILSNNSKPNTEQGFDNKFIAFPNPFTDSFQVNFSIKETGSKCNLTLVNMSGQIVYKGISENLNKGEYSRIIQVDIPRGTYVMRFTVNNKVKTTVIIKQ